MHMPRFWVLWLGEESWSASLHSVWHQATLSRQIYPSYICLVSASCDWARKQSDLLHNTAWHQATLSKQIYPSYIHSECCRDIRQSRKTRNSLGKCKISKNEKPIFKKKKNQQNFNKNDRHTVTRDCTCWWRGMRGNHQPPSTAGRRQAGTHTHTHTHTHRGLADREQPSETRPPSGLWASYFPISIPVPARASWENR